MGLELVIFILAIAFGILLYWRESNGNGLYRMVNKIVNSKELQMKDTDRMGFVYKQNFLLRLVFITLLLTIVGVIIQFLTPISIFTSYYGFSAYASSIVGTLLGSYLAHFVIKSGKIIEDKKEDIGEFISETIEKGEDFIEDLSSDDNKKEEAEITKEEDGEKQKDNDKSARERLKDKGLI